MQPIDYMRSAALLLAFSVTLSKDVKTWLLADFVATTVFGLGWFLLPDGLLGYQTDGQLNEVHQYFTQLFGIMMLTMAVIWYECRRSPDANVTNALLTCKVVALFVLLISMAQAQLQYRGDKQKFNEQHISFGILGCSLWFLGNLYHLIRSSSFGTFSDAPNNMANRLMLISSLLCFMNFASQFGFPGSIVQFIAKKNFQMDGIHLHMIQAVGCLFLAFGVLMLRAIYFRDNADKRIIFLAGLVGSVIAMSNLTLHQLYFGTFDMTKLIWFSTTYVGATSAINAYGYYITS